MKAKKSIIYFMLAVFAVCSVAAQNNLETKDFVANETNVKTLGRTYFADDVLWMGFSSSGVEFEINAKKLDITFSGDSGAVMRRDNGSAARVVVFVNGERKLDEMLLSRSKTFKVFEESEPVKGLVQIIKVSESANSLAGIKKITVDPEGTVTPAAKRDLKIEFVGDSITCGYGVDDLNRNNHFKTSTEDNTKTYAYKTAQNLNADYSMVSVSGWGIASGYSSDGKKNTGCLIPSIYEKTGFSWNNINGKAIQNFDWDFSKFVPDFVVVNLGTNDSSYTKGESKKIDEYKSEYVKFLKTIRKNNPDAKIICTLGIMGQDLCDAIEDVVKIYSQETGDTKVYSLKFDVQKESDGIAADWHPSEKTHQKTAALLTKKIQTLMGE